MSGLRIRTIKPEWLEDEDLLRAGSDGRVLSVALILLADDYGRGRCVPEVLAAQVFAFEDDPARIFRDSLARLFAIGFVRLYVVRGQRYFEVRNWTKHQRVDKPGKPRVPPPESNDSYVLLDSGEARESSRERSRDTRESLAPDLDLEMDLEGRGPRANPRETEPPPPLGSVGDSPGLTTVGGSSTAPNGPPAALTGAERVAFAARLAAVGDDPEADSEPAAPTTGPRDVPRTVLLRRAFYAVVAGGKEPLMASPTDEAAFRAIAAELDRGDHADPVGFFTHVLQAYDAKKGNGGDVANPVFFARDFVGWAERVSRERLGRQSGPVPESRNLLPPPPPREAGGTR